MARCSGRDLRLRRLRLKLSCVAELVGCGVSLGYGETAAARLGDGSLTQPAQSRRLERNRLVLSHPEHLSAGQGYSWREDIPGENISLPWEKLNSGVVNIPLE